LSQGEEKRGGIHQPFYGTWVADFMLRQDAGRFMLGENPMAAKETIGDGGGRKYANNEYSDQNRQDAFNRVLAVQNSARGPR